MTKNENIHQSGGTIPTFLGFTDPFRLGLRIVEMKRLAERYKVWDFLVPKRGFQGGTDGAMDCWVFLGFMGFHDIHDYPMISMINHLFQW